jgi:hypothetical protein
LRTIAQVRYDKGTMSEFEQFNPPGNENESSKAEDQLSLLQAKIAEPRRLPNAMDLVDVVNCELEDNGGRNASTPAAKRLRRVRDIAVDVAVRDFDGIGEEERSDVNAYLDDQIDQWKAKANAPLTTESRREFALSNVQIFSDLREHIFEQRQPEEDVQEGLLDLEAYANISQTTEDGVVERADALALLDPEYIFKPTLGLKVLEELRGRGEISEKEVQSLFNMTVLDMEALRERIKTDHPGMIEAVNYARSFYANPLHGEDPDLHKKRIFVAIWPDGKVHAGFNPPGQTLPEGTQRFAFTLAGDPSDPRDLIANAEYIDDFERVYQDSQQAQTAVTKLYKKDEEFLKLLEDWDDGAIEEIRSTTRLVERLKSYLKENNTDDEYTEAETMDFETLDKIAAMIMSKSGLDNEDDEDDDLENDEDWNNWEL